MPIQASRSSTPAASTPPTASVQSVRDAGAGEPAAATTDTQRETCDTAPAGAAAPIAGSGTQGSSRHAASSPRQYA